MTHCIVCQGSGIKEFLDLGATSLANKFLTDQELQREESVYPLRVGFCECCAHVQLMEHVAPEEMFENYLYVSSVSDTLKAHLRDLAGVVTDRMNLSSDDLVIDVGCNDGTLLTRFKELGIRTLGVDPAQNLAERARKNGVETITTFFGEESAREIKNRWGSASAITATNTFPHIPDLRGFVEGIAHLLTDKGCFVLEAHYLLDLLNFGAFDTIYHEHVSYWALKPMVRLFSEFDMQIVDVERLPLHHGQIRVWVKKGKQNDISASVDRLLATEKEAGLHRFDTFQSFAVRTFGIREDLNSTLKNLRAGSKRVVGYGAPAKGNTLLTFLGIGPDQIEYIADRSPLKQGRYTPGTHIPVVPAERILEDQPDYVLLLAWNFADEILQQQSDYRDRGGRFIIPVPEVRIV